MTQRTKLWLTCEACDYTWPAAQLPVDLSDVVKEVRKLKSCPSCGAKRSSVVLASESAIVAATNKRQHAGGYVIAYDAGPAGTPKEEYYGFFISVEECRRAWADFSARSPGKLVPRNPRICRIVECIVPDAWKEPASAPKPRPPAEEKPKSKRAVAAW